MAGRITFPDTAYFALPHVFNHIVYMHCSGITMTGVFDDHLKLERAINSVPGVAYLGIVSIVAMLFSHLPLCRTPLRIWMRIRCRHKLLLDQMAYVPLLAEQVALSNRLLRARVLDLCVHTLAHRLCLNAFQESWADASTLVELCCFIVTESGCIDQTQTLRRVHAYFHEMWPGMHNPNGDVLEDAARSARDFGFDRTWLAFLYIYETVWSIQQAHLSDLRKAVALGTPEMHARRCMFGCVGACGSPKRCGERR